MKIVLGISGASGSIYAERLLKAIIEFEIETYCIISPSAIKVFQEERNISVQSPEQFIDYIVHKYHLTNNHKISIRHFHNIGCDIASGSNEWEAMLVVPCSMKTLASIKSGFSDNLITRSADVSLKEKRKLILMPRETPYSSIHLENMLALSNMGVFIVPASPGFYQNPQSLEDLADFMVSRVLTIIGIFNQLFEKWKG